MENKKDPNAKFSVIGLLSNCQKLHSVDFGDNVPIWEHWTMSELSMLRSFTSRQKFTLRHWESVRNTPVFKTYFNKHSESYPNGIVHWYEAGTYRKTGNSVVFKPLP
eukprot:238630-Pleurochrysis_carterae.AAC.1